MNERDWFAYKMEECRSWTISEDKQKQLGLEMLKSQVALHHKFIFISIFTISVRSICSSHDVKFCCTCSDFCNFIWTREVKMIVKVYCLD